MASYGIATAIPDVQQSGLQGRAFLSYMQSINCWFCVIGDLIVFFMFGVQEENACIAVSIIKITVIMGIRSFSDIAYVYHIRNQFKFRYAGYLVVDVLSILPVPQVIVFATCSGSGGAQQLMNHLLPALWIQSIPRLFRMWPLWSQASFDIFEFVWVLWAFVGINSLICVHVVGSIWYVVGMQMAASCLHNACLSSGLQRCMEFINCPFRHSTFHSDPTWLMWQKNGNATACFSGDHLDYGIFDKAVKLTTQESVINHYLSSLYWGFQQISTLTGKLKPTTGSVWEVLFLLAIMAIGVILLGIIVIGIIFLQNIYRRRSERSIKIRNVTEWTERVGLPLELRRKIIQAEYNRVVTGVNEEASMEFPP